MKIEDIIADMRLHRAARRQSHRLHPRGFQADGGPAAEVGLT